MINVNDNTILNPENVVIAEQKGSMYKLTLTNGKILYVNSDVYEDIIAYEPVSKQYVDSKLSGTIKRLIVQSLPTEDIDTNTIYMVLDPSSVAPNNVYNEYMYISSTWELIGTTQANGVEVIANPTLVGTESALTGLQVDTTKYKVPRKYMHNIVIVYNGTSNIIARIHVSINIERAEPFVYNPRMSVNEFCDYLESNGFNSSNKCIPASGLYVTSDSNRRSIDALYAYDGYFKCVDYDVTTGDEQTNSISSTSSNLIGFEDTVI